MLFRFVILVLFACAAPIGMLAELCVAEESETLFGDWGGVKSSLEERGVTLEAGIINDVMGVASGGLDRGVFPVTLYQLGGEIDTAKLGAWEDGTFVFNLIGITGGPLWQHTGDFQVSSNIDGMGWDTVTLYEAFYEHSFLDGDLSFLFGLHDYNSEFYALDYSLTLINSSFGFGPELSQIVNSTYPVTALAFRARYQPTENSYVLAAVYDGVPGKQGHYKGTSIILDRSDGIFYSAEAGVTSTEEDTPTHYYKVALGAWYRSTDYTDYSDAERSNDSGAYLIGERKIYSEEDPKQGLGIFGQFGKTQGDRNFIATYYGAGLHYTGLIPTRDEDITTVGVANAHHGGQYKGFDQEAASAETAMEFSYRAPIAFGLTLQPDIQYIMNPGLQKQVNHALVLGSRVELAF